MSASEIKTVSDQLGNPVEVIIPIELWREIASERETAYLLKSEAMKKRLFGALSRQGGISFEDACAKLGL